MSSLQVFPATQTGLPSPSVKWHVVDRRNKPAITGGATEPASAKKANDDTRS
jgi:hypothetical protein